MEEGTSFPSERPNVSISRRLNRTLRRFSLPAETPRPCLDSVTGEVLEKGIWTTYAVSTPLRLNKERLHDFADNLALRVMHRLDLDQAPEVAVRNCRGLSSLDGAKHSILVRITWTDKKVIAAYALISCAGTTDYSLLLFKGLLSASNVMAEFLWRYFHCQVKQLPLPPRDLALFFSFWVSILESTSTSEEVISLSVRHPVITTCKLEMTVPLPKAAKRLKQLGVGPDIFEEDAEKFVNRLYKEFGSVLPVEYSAFTLKSIHLPVGSLDYSGKVRFVNRETANDVVRYLATLANDVLA